MPTLPAGNLCHSCPSASAEDTDKFPHHVITNRPCLQLFLRIREERRELAPFGTRVEGLTSHTFIPRGTCPAQEPDHSVGSVKTYQMSTINLGLGLAELISPFVVVALNVLHSSIELARPRTDTR